MASDADLEAKYQLPIVFAMCCVFTTKVEKTKEFAL